MTRRDFIGSLAVASAVCAMPSQPKRIVYDRGRLTPRKPKPDPVWFDPAAMFQTKPLGPTEHLVFVKCDDGKWYHYWRDTPMTSAELYDYTYRNGFYYT